MYERLDEVSCLFDTADVPDAPVDVHWTVCDGRVVQLHWKLLSENYSPVRQFIIEYNTSWSPGVWRAARSDIGRDTRYMRVALSPWSNYSFRVVAQNGVGRSRASAVSRPWCTTPPDVPRRHPQPVCSRNGPPHTLVISWQVYTDAEPRTFPRTQRHFPIPTYIPQTYSTRISRPNVAKAM